LVRFAKGLNRSVTGSITDLVNLAKIWLVEKDLSPHDVALKLNEVPMSAISTSVPGSHGIPRNAFQAMVSTAGMETKNATRNPTVAKVRINFDEAS
jgi:hypothetical protein